MLLRVVFRASAKNVSFKPVYIFGYLDEHAVNTTLI